MIHKIERISSIGKFRSYQASGDVSFKKMTLFYADNGSGKTTLTSILRSLTQNRPELIRRRVSTNSTERQGAQVVHRESGTDTHHTFNNSGWTAPIPDIEIFDIHFVNENIYSGFDFTDDHKKQLHQFVVGAQGVAIQQQMEQNKNLKTASRLAISNYETELIRKVGNNLTNELMLSFLAIKAREATDIEQKISNAETALVKCNRLDFI